MPEVTAAKTVRPELIAFIKPPPFAEDHDRLDWSVVFGIEIEIESDDVGTESSRPLLNAVTPATQWAQHCGDSISLGEKPSNVIG